MWLKIKYRFGSYRPATGGHPTYPQFCTSGIKNPRWLVQLCGANHDRFSPITAKLARTIPATAPITAPTGASKYSAKTPIRENDAVLRT